MIKLSIETMDEEVKESNIKISILCCSQKDLWGHVLSFFLKVAALTIHLHAVEN